jgi:molybdopterin-binding protein
LEEPVKLSARNALNGRVVEVVPGVTTAKVKIAIAGNAVITASITMEAVHELGLAVGDEATAIIKASDVSVGKA